MNTISSEVQGDMQFQENVPKMSSYMRFLGILSIIFGALYCLTIIGAVFGIPAIFIGIRMREAADNFIRYSSSGSFQDLSNAIERQTRFFFIQYVLAIIGLVLMVIYFIVIIPLLLSSL